MLYMLYFDTWLYSNEDVFQIPHLPFKVTSANIKENTKIEFIISVTKAEDDL